MRSFAPRFAVIYSIRWPERYASILSVLKIFAFDVAGALPVQCITNYGFNAYLMVLIIGTTVVNTVFYFLVTITNGKMGRRFVVNMALRKLFLFFNFLIYIHICSACFRAFPCHTLPDGSSRLRADYSVDCSTSTYSLGTAFAVVGCVLYVAGVPLIFLKMLNDKKGAIMKNQSLRGAVASSTINKAIETGTHQHSIQNSGFDDICKLHSKNIFTKK